MNIITKKCGKCGEIKGIDSFYTKHGKPYSPCKVCVLASQSIYQHNNLDKVRENARKRRAKNPEKFNADRARWVKENPDKRKQIVRNYHVNHKEQEKIKDKKWKKSNPSKVRKFINNWFTKNPHKSTEYNQKRRAIKLKVGGVITSKEWKNLLEKYDNTCLCCNRKDVKLTLDHVIPLSRGGSNTIENAQPLCRSCNSSKHDKIIDYR